MTMGVSTKESLLVWLGVALSMDCTVVVVEEY